MVRPLFSVLVALKLAQMSPIGWDRIGIVTAFAWATDTACATLWRWTRQGWEAWGW